jgi:hypothetical protein
MIETSDRKELERRLEQAKRAAALGTTPSPLSASRSWSEIWKNSFGCRSRSTLSIGPMSIDLVVRRMRPWDRLGGGR